MTFENEDFIVKPSQIHGLGLFAKRKFRKEEVVLRWNPVRLSGDGLKKIPDNQKRYLNTSEDGAILLMQAPERFVNHSEHPNTQTVGETDVALRDIEIGEEITSSYPL